MTRIVIAALAGAGTLVGSQLLWQFVARHSNTQVHQVRP